MVALKIGYATFILNPSSFPQLFYFSHDLFCGKDTVIKIISECLMVRWCSFGNSVFIGYSEDMSTRHFLALAKLIFVWWFVFQCIVLAFTLGGEKERISIISQHFVLCTRMSYPIYSCIRISLLHRCGTLTKLNAAPKAVLGNLIFIILSGHG